MPAIATLQPASATAGSGAFTLTVNGTGFINGSIVKFGGSARTTTYVSATQVTAAILASDIASAGTPSVTVTNPTPGGGTSSAAVFTINGANNPVPAIATLQPASATAGSGAFTLTVNGTGFINGSSVKFGGSARTTTYVSATQVTAAILASDIASAGTPSVTVTNPTPGGGTSSAATFSVNNPVPSITVLQPQSVTAGAATFTLTVNGTGFNSTSIVSFNGSSQPTTFVSGTQLSAAIAAAEVANTGVVPVSVTNSGPGGGTATAVNFAIIAATTPQASLSPSTLAFPGTIVGATAVAKSITLSNIGNAALSINGITIGGAAPADFSQTNNCGNSLAAGSNCSISVSFTPISAAAFAATVSVADNASVSPQSVSLSGTGTPAPAPDVVLTPASLSFTAVAGTTTAAQTATLKNTGDAQLTITAIAITGANSSSFNQTSTCGESLLPGASCSISITFTPAAATSYTASLSVTDNATGSPQAIALNGTGTTAPSFTIASSTAAQTIQPGGTANYSMTIVAHNGAIASPVALAVTGLPAGATATFAPASVTPGSSSATSQLTIQTAAPSTQVAGIASIWPLAISVPPLLGLFLAIGKRRRRWLALALVLVASLGAAAALSGCGGGFSLPGADAKTYTITVTGTSGSEQQSTTVQLTVK